MARIANIMVIASAFVLLAVASAVANPAAATPTSPTCSELDQISVTLANGSTRCVENTCEAIMGAQGNPEACTEGAGISSSVPVAAPADDSSSTPAATSSEAGSSNMSIWISLLIGVGLGASLIAGYGMIRNRSRRESRKQARS